MTFLLDEVAGGKAPWGQRCTREKKRAWHRFVKKRFSLGRCIRCNRKHLPDAQCCATHKEINRQKCFSWAVKNRAYVYEKYYSRKATGVCVNSENHGKAESPSPYCAKCRAKARRSKKRFRSS